MKRICVTCGLNYSYNSADPRGATTTECPSCQKKSGRLRRRWDLLLIAGNGEVQCRCCGYRKYPYAIKMIEARDFLIEPPAEDKARASLLICLNCNEAIKSGDIRMQVKDSSTYPVEVSFYELNVSVEYSEMEQHLRRHSPEALEMEVYDGKENHPIRNVSATHARLAGESPE